MKRLLLLPPLQLRGGTESPTQEGSAVAYGILSVPYAGSGTGSVDGTRRHTSNTTRLANSKLGSV